MASFAKAPFIPGISSAALLRLAFCLLVSAGQTAAGKAAEVEMPAADLDRRYDQCSVVMTHNAMSNRAEGWLFPNQNHSLTQQLNAGVRGLMLDVHLFQGRPYLIHNSHFLGKRLLVDGLHELGRFLDEHPQAIVTIIFESYVPASVVQAAFKDASLLERLHCQSVTEAWPTLRKMVDTNRRLVVFTDREGGSWPGYHDVWRFCWETPFSVKAVEKFNFVVNRGRLSNSLIILNHFITRPTAGVSLARKANARAVLQPRLTACLRETGRHPHFITVDFYDVGDTLQVVREFHDTLLDSQAGKETVP
ncbi:MAG: hypothetical protein MK165_17290 [Pirellulaceae bacterium]|nr:hypothetical protein [Pirellulaceae bacterium]